MAKKGQSLAKEGKKTQKSAMKKATAKAETKKKAVEKKKPAAKKKPTVVLSSDEEEEDEEEMEEEVYHLKECKINEEEYDDVQFERIVLKCIARNGLKKTSFKALHHNIRKHLGYNIYKEGQKYFKNLRENS